jgi:5-methylcytosine-specific restriction enzyme subunit McrC
VTHLSVSEWNEVAVYDGAGEPPTNTFTRAQSDTLIAAAKAHPLGGDSAAKILVELRHSLKAQQMVGVIAAKGCSLEILPKIDRAALEDAPTVRQRLVHMLDVALGLNIGVGEATAMARQNHSLLDIFIRKFADGLLAEARRGLPRAYLAQEDDLAALRGRLDVVRQFTVNAVRPDRLACRFDVLSSDIPLLQIMKACVVNLRAFARSTDTIRRLDELRFVLADISDLPVTILPWQMVRIDRTNRRWETLYSLAKLFLKREWQATHHDRNAAQGITLLFPMNDLFEAYIAALAQRAKRGAGVSVKAQGGGRFCLTEDPGGAKLFKTIPDLLIAQRNQNLMIIDTKWKTLAQNIEDKKGGISQADVYQMMTYAQLYECPKVVLLYPHHRGLGEVELDRRYKIAGSDRRLWVASVALEFGETAVVERLSKLISKTALEN